MNILGSVLEVAAKILKLSRDAFATNLEEAAKQVRAGKLIPDEAFARAIEDQELLDEIYGRRR
jgi:hypothetical protein